MHIAVCDDIVVDRKQLERLLAREGDKRRGLLNGLYVDSFGNKEALLSAPMTYDLYFIDFDSEGITGYDLCQSLISLGKGTRIVMCCGRIDYRDLAFPRNTMFIEKPIKVDELSKIIDVVEESLKGVEPSIELREDNGKVFWIKESELVYATSKGSFITIEMSDGQSATILSTFDHFYSQLQTYPNIMAVNGHTIVNASHITKFDKFKVTMPGETSFTVTPRYLKYARFIYESIKNQQENNDSN